MFTGIVSQRGTVSQIARAGPSGAARLAVALERPLPGTAPGDSVSIDGVCLTVVEVRGETLGFDVVPETLRRTTLGARRPGDRVNVEGALRAGDALGGHLVQGHVDGVGVVEEVDRRASGTGADAGPGTAGDVRMTIRAPSPDWGATVAKGSVAVDGVSLTVGESEEGRFSVYLVPHTLAVTGLGSKRPGDPVNLEADVVGRYVEQAVRRALAARADVAPEVAS
jgi:riboflavin synthase alpha subunit